MNLAELKSYVNYLWDLHGQPGRTRYSKNFLEMIIAETQREIKRIEEQVLVKTLNY